MCQKNQRLASDLLPRKPAWEARGKQRRGTAKLPSYCSARARRSAAISTDTVRQTCSARSAGSAWRQAQNRRQCIRASGWRAYPFQVPRPGHVIAATPSHCSKGESIVGVDARVRLECFFLHFPTPGTRGLVGLRAGRNRRGQGKHYPVIAGERNSLQFSTLARPILVSTRWIGKSSPPARNGPERIEKSTVTALFRHSS